MPYIGRTLGQGTRSRFLYTATAGQTTFSGSDSQSNTLAYSDNNGVDCFQNGVLLKGGGADYTATSGTSVVLTTGASVSDVIEILVYDVFAIADHVKKSGDAMTGALTITTDDNTTQLTLKSTDADASQGPVLDLHRDSASPSDDDAIGNITFSGENDASEKIGLVKLIGLNSDVTDGTEDGRLQLYIHKDGSSVNRMDFQPTETTFNDDSVDIDFRVEGNGKANLLKVDAGNDFVLFGTPSLPDGSNGGAGFESAGDNRMILNLGCTTTSSRNVAVFRNSNNGVGSINVSGSSTGFNTSSDYRLKENVVTDWDATTRLKQLKPSRFNFKTDKDTTVDGFLAHEVSSVVPVAITGEKDAVDKDGNPEYQGIDQSKLVPLLTKALQEAVAKIEILEAKVTALEGK